jgi:hypothetical protein
MQGGPREFSNTRGGGGLLSVFQKVFSILGGFQREISTLKTRYFNLVLAKFSNKWGGGVPNTRPSSFDAIVFYIIFQMEFFRM